MEYFTQKHNSFEIFSKIKDDHRVKVVLALSLSVGVQCVKKLGFPVEHNKCHVSLAGNVLVNFQSVAW